MIFMQMDRFRVEHPLKEVHNKNIIISSGSCILAYDNNLHSLQRTTNQTQMRLIKILAWFFNAYCELWVERNRLENPLMPAKRTTFFAIIKIKYSPSPYAFMYSKLTYAPAHSQHTLAVIWPHRFILFLIYLFSAKIRTINVRHVWILIFFHIIRFSFLCHNLRVRLAINME